MGVAAAPTGAIATTYTGSRVGSFSNSAYFEETTGNGPQMGPGNTLIAMVDLVSSTNGGFLWTNESTSGTRGWRLSISSGGSGQGAFVFQIGGTNVVPSGAGFTGRGVIAITCIADGHYRASVNGHPVQGFAAISYSAPIAGDYHVIGNSKQYVGNPWAPFLGSVCELAWLDREATDAELAAWSGVANADDRMSLLSACTADPSTQFWWKAATHWDGSAATSVAGGSVPVTFAKVGTPAKSTASERRFVFGDRYFSDTASKVAAGAAPANYYQRDPFARLTFTTSATRIAVDAIKPPVSNSGLGLRVNGAFVSEFDAYTYDGNRWVTELVIAAGADKAVEIVMGCCSHVSPGVWAGQSVQAIREIDGDTITPVAVVAPANRLVVFGDSISNGIASDYRTSEGWTMLVRADYPGGVTVVGYGAMTLFDFAVNDAARTTLAARLCLACRSSSGGRKLWIAIGTNDHLSSPWTAAAFGAAYADLLDKIHAVDSSIHIYTQSQTAKTTTGANLLGSTAADYDTQISSAAAARPSFCTFVDGSTIVSLADLYDGVHPTSAGHAIYKTSVKSTLGY